MILAAVWKVHNDQHQITVSPCVDKYLVHLETPKVRFLMARRSIKEGRDTIYFVGQGIFNVSFSSRQKYRNYCTIIYRVNILNKKNLEKD